MLTLDNNRRSQPPSKATLNAIRDMAIQLESISHTTRRDYGRQMPLCIFTRQLTTDTIHTFHPHPQHLHMTLPHTERAPTDPHDKAVRHFFGHSWCPELCCRHTDLCIYNDDSYIATAMDSIHSPMQKRECSDIAAIPQCENVVIGGRRRLQTSTSLTLCASAASRNAGWQANHA
eukprot:scaffold146996_cov50-Prasinocladus_malaysianus.AAC.1